MIRLGLRLTLQSGREPMLRVLVTAAAVAPRRRPAVAPWPVSTGCTLKPTAVRGWTPRRRRHDRPRHPTDCGGCPAPISSATRRSTGSTLPRPGGTLRSRLGFPTCQGRVTTSPRPPSRPFFGPNRRMSCATGFRGADRDHRRSGAAVPELADHRHRPHHAPALAGTWCGRGQSHPTHAGQLLRLPEHHRERTRSAVHPGPRSRRALAASADPDRDRQPTVDRAARGALCRDAPRRRHAASDLGLRGGGSRARGSPSSLPAPRSGRSAQSPPPAPVPAEAARGKTPRRPVPHLLDVELSRFRPSSFRPRPGACRAPHDARSAQCDGGPPDPIPSSAEELVRGRRVRSAGADVRDRQVRTGSVGGEHRLLPFEPPWA